mmetsp:Transcript_23341/g.48574  ORF Transcript_23341/g.48574 Transcript_23341/m.48574 type:complete len:192 (+) Transcript_23341:77-652(+)
MILDKGSSKDSNSVEILGEPSWNGKFSDRTIIQICCESLSRETVSPFFFRHNKKYFVAFKSECPSVPVKSLRFNGNVTQAGQKNGSYNSCTCGSKCRGFDEIICGPNGKIWRQAIQKRTGPVEEIVVKECSFIVFQINSPIDGSRSVDCKTDNTKKSSSSNTTAKLGLGMEKRKLVGNGDVRPDDSYNPVP